LRSNVVSRAIQSVSRSRLLFRGGISWLVAAIVAVAGCSSFPVPGLSNEPLVTVETRGGMCPAGVCGQTIYLERDGRVHSAAKPPNDLGQVRPDAMAALDAAIRTTDYTAMKSRKFTGDCPTNFDGQELIFTFAVPGGSQRIASCEVDIDWGSSLFVAVGVALGEWVQLPLT